MSEIFATVLQSLKYKSSFLNMVWIIMVKTLCLFVLLKIFWLCFLLCLIVIIGPIAEIYLPIDILTKKNPGFAFVSYVFAEHAVKAFTELDGTIFQVYIF